MSKDSYEKFIKKNLGINSQEMEYKKIPFTISHDTKVLKRKGEDIFVFEGYASTPSLDRGGDVVAPGAFSSTIERKKSQGNRPIRMKYQHNAMEIIGGFPIEKVKEDEKGLWVVGEICLGVQRGKETAALIKGGYLSDLSIGFNVIDFEMKDNARVIKDLELWEISVVDEPMNTESEIMNFKSVVPFHDLPLAPDTHPWDKSSAERRVREFTKSKDDASSGYKKAFFWYDSEKPKLFTSYKLPFADVVDGQLKAVPRAIFAVAAVLDGARGGVDIPEQDKQKIKRQVEKYYKKMGRESPFKTESSINRITVPELKQALLNPRTTEKLFKATNFFSKSSVTYLGGLLSNLYNKSRASELEHEFERGGKYLAEEGHPRPGESFRFDDEEIENPKPKKRRRKMDPMLHEEHEEELYEEMEEELEELEDLHREERMGRKKRRRKERYEAEEEREIEEELYEDIEEDVEALESLHEDDKMCDGRKQKSRRKEIVFDRGPEDDESWNEEIEEIERAPRRKKKPGFDLARDEYDPEFQDEVEEEEGRLARRKRRKSKPGFDLAVNEYDEGLQEEISEEEGRLARRRKAKPGFDLALDEYDPSFQDEVSEEEGRLARRKRRYKEVDWDDERVNENEAIRDLEHREEEALERELRRARQKSSDDDDIDYIDNRDFQHDDDMDEHNMETYRVMRKLLHEARKLLHDVNKGY